MQNKTVLITGATDGIGRQTALELARLGAQVIVHGRNLDRINQTVQDISQASGNSKVVGLQADFSSLQAVREMANQLKNQFKELHVLINNAGVFEPTLRLSQDGFEMTFAVNHLAHFLLTCLLFDLLQRSAPARIINVSSMAHSDHLDFDNLQGEKSYSGYQAYAYSKLANILFTFKLARMLNPQTITANCLHPGVIDTKLLRAGWGMGGDSLEAGARTSVYLATAKELQHVSGKYFVDGGQERKPAAIAYDEKAQDQLWQLSEELCGCRFTL